MRLQHFLISAVLVSASCLCACTEKTGLPAEAKQAEERLAWVENVDPAKMFRDDGLSGKKRFLAICGFACVPAGVGSLTASICYPRVRVEQIEGTSDMRLSQRHTDLINRATVVAKRYNTLVAEAEQRAGRYACNSKADWDSALGDLSALVAYATSQQSERSVSIDPKNRVFKLLLPIGAASDVFYEAACGALRKYNLLPQASISVASEGTSDASSKRIACEQKG